SDVCSSDLPLLVERQGAPALVVLAVEVAQYAAGQGGQRDAMAAVAQRVVDVAVLAAHAHGAHAAERDADRAGPTRGDAQAGRAWQDLGEAPADSLEATSCRFGRVRVLRAVAPEVAVGSVAAA